MFTKIHQNRWILVDDESTRIHLFLPRKFTFYVHEKSATQENMRELRETQKPSLGHGMFSYWWNARKVCLMFENVSEYVCRKFRYDGFLSHLQKRTALPTYILLQSPLIKSRLKRVSIVGKDFFWYYTLSGTYHKNLPFVFVVVVWKKQKTVIVT